MAINYITVKGCIRNGQINVDLPANVEDGEVEIKIPIQEPDENPR